MRLGSDGDLPYGETDALEGNDNDLTGLGDDFIVFDVAVIVFAVSSFVGDNLCVCCRITCPLLVFPFRNDDGPAGGSFVGNGDDACAGRDRLLNLTLLPFWRVRLAFKGLCIIVCSSPFL